MAWVSISVAFWLAWLMISLERAVAWFTISDALALASLSIAIPLALAWRTMVSLSTSALARSSALRISSSASCLAMDRISLRSATTARACLISEGILRRMSSIRSLMRSASTMHLLVRGRVVALSSTSSSSLRMDSRFAIGHTSFWVSLPCICG